MTQRGPRRDPAKERLWRRLFQLWHRSDQTIRDFCGQHHVSEASFFAWRRTIAERDRQSVRSRRTSTKPASSTHSARQRQGHAKAEPAFVPLRVVHPVSNAAFEVVLKNGRVVRVPAPFDADTLRQLLAILEEERPC